MRLHSIRPIESKLPTRYVGKKTSRASKDLNPKEIAALVQAAAVSEQEIEDWHADFLEQYPSGRLDRKAFIEYAHKVQANAEGEASLSAIFDHIDANNDGTVDFNELLVVLVLISRLNSLESRLAFAFDMWDGSGDGYIQREELSEVLSAMYNRAGVFDRKNERDPKKRANEIIAKLDLSGDKKLSKDEFIKGCKSDPVLHNILAPHAAT